MDLPAIAEARIGGDVAVDFFNTVDWRLDPLQRGERLISYLHLVAWAHEGELLTDAEASEVLGVAARRQSRARQEHAAALALREDTYAALIGDKDPALLRERVVGAVARSVLLQDEDGRWAWSQSRVDLRTPLDRIALELLRLLTSPQVALFHRCHDDACGWVFLDTSRHHNRKWCVAADCGNRNRVRAHYARTRRGGRTS